VIAQSSQAFPQYSRGERVSPGFSSAAFSVRNMPLSYSLTGSSANGAGAGFATPSNSIAGAENEGHNKARSGQLWPAK